MLAPLALRTTPVPTRHVSPSSSVSLEHALWWVFTDEAAGGRIGIGVQLADGSHRSRERLIAGQQQYSGRTVAELVIEALGH